MESKFCMDTGIEGLYLGPRWVEISLSVYVRGSSWKFVRQTKQSLKRVKPKPLSDGPTPHILDRRVRNLEAFQTGPVNHATSPHIFNV